MDRYGDSHIIESLGQNVCNAKNPLWQVDTGIFDKKTLLPITGITYKGVEFEGQQTEIQEFTKVKSQWTVETEDDEVLAFELLKLAHDLTTKRSLRVTATGVD